MKVFDESINLKVIFWKLYKQQFLPGNISPVKFPLVELYPVKMKRRLVGHCIPQHVFCQCWILHKKYFIQIHEITHTD